MSATPAPKEKTTVTKSLRGGGLKIAFDTVDDLKLALADLNLTFQACNNANTEHTLLHGDKAPTTNLISAVIYRDKTSKKPTIELPVGFALDGIVVDVDKLKALNIVGEGYTLLENTMPAATKAPVRTGAAPGPLTPVTEVTSALTTVSLGKRVADTVPKDAAGGATAGAGSGSVVATVPAANHETNSAKTGINFTGANAADYETAFRNWCLTKGYITFKENGFICGNYRGEGLGAPAGAGAAAGAGTGAGASTSAAAGTKKTFAEFLSDEKNVAKFFELAKAFAPNGAFPDSAPADRFGDIALETGGKDNKTAKSATFGSKENASLFQMFFKAKTGINKELTTSADGKKVNLEVNSRNFVDGKKGLKHTSDKIDSLSSAFTKNLLPDLVSLDKKRASDTRDGAEGDDLDSAGDFDTALKELIEAIHNEAMVAQAAEGKTGRVAQISKAKLLEAKAQVEVKKEVLLDFIETGSSASKSTEQITFLTKTFRQELENQDPSYDNLRSFLQIRAKDTGAGAGAGGGGASADAPPAAGAGGGGGAGTPDEDGYGSVASDDEGRGSKDGGGRPSGSAKVDGVDGVTQVAPSKTTVLTPDSL